MIQYNRKIKLRVKIIGKAKPKKAMIQNISGEMYLAIEAIVKQTMVI